MAIKWSDLKNKTRELDIKFQGESLKVTYRINVVTPAFLQEISDVENHDKDTLVWQLNRIIERWDVLDDKGEPLEPNEEFLRQLPVAFLANVMTAISSDMKDTPDDEEKKG